LFMSEVPLYGTAAPVCAFFFVFITLDTGPRKLLSLYNHRTTRSREYRAQRRAQPLALTLNPTPYEPYTLHPTPYTISGSAQGAGTRPHPEPYTLHPTPYILHQGPRHGPTVRS